MPTNISPTQPRPCTAKAPRPRSAGIAAGKPNSIKARSSIGAGAETSGRTAAHKAEALHKERGYFHNNRKRMNYLDLRSEGCPIGSGMVESAAKQYKARFCGPDMRWSRKGAERLLPVRTAILSSRFDKMRRLAYNSPPN